MWLITVSTLINELSAYAISIGYFVNANCQFRSFLSIFLFCFFFSSPPTRLPFPVIYVFFLRWWIVWAIRFNIIFWNFTLWLSIGRQHIIVKWPNIKDTFLMWNVSIFFFELELCTKEQIKRSHQPRITSHWKNKLPNTWRVHFSFIYIIIFCCCSF